MSENLYLLRRKKSIVRKALWPNGVSLSPILLLVILRRSVNRIRFSYVIRVLCNVLVPSVASRYLIFVVASQTVANLHSRCTVESILERVANDAEVRQSHPASFDRTRARHSMAFALFAHLLLNVL